MDAPQQQDLTQDPYGIPPRVMVTLVGLVPKVGQHVGVRRGDSDVWLPFTFKGAGKRSVFFVSPINGSTFAFDRRDPWEWRPWKECPQRTERCPSCKGTGEYLSKKKLSVTPCKKCSGAGRVPTADPFVA